VGYRVSLYLADACAIVGFYRQAPNFPPRLRTLLENDSGSVAVTAATVWEISIKVALGKLADVHSPRHATLTGMLIAHGYEVWPFDPDTAERAAALPRLHGDPFDRALVASAQRTGRTVLTSDRAIARYGVPTLW
jgi:PIN domain nuclease of toxin-antitoxin system